MATIKLANLALRFLLELCALAALGTGAFKDTVGEPRTGAILSTYTAR